MNRKSLCERQDYLAAKFQPCLILSSDGQAGEMRALGSRLPCRDKRTSLRKLRLGRREAAGEELNVARKALNVSAANGKQENHSIIGVLRVPGCFGCMRVGSRASRSNP